MVIGALNAASKPLIDGFPASVCACRATWPFNEVNQVSALWLVGSENAALRSAKGSSMPGSVLKNSTPALKSLMVRPLVGSSSRPPGICTLMKTWSGPSSESPRRMVNPARPAIENPPWMPR